MVSKKSVSELEFVAMMASLIFISALAIDGLLPALDIIGLSVGVGNPIKNQQLIIIIFLGLELDHYLSAQFQKASGVNL